MLKLYLNLKNEIILSEKVLNTTVCYISVSLRINIHNEKVFTDTKIWNGSGLSWKNVFSDNSSQNICHNEIGVSLETSRANLFWFSSTRFWFVGGEGGGAGGSLA